MGLWLARLIAFAALVVLILAQKCTYTVVFDLPTTQGTDPSNMAYVGVGPTGTDVDLICPAGIEFLGPDNVAIIDADTRRVVDVDLGQRAVTSALSLPGDHAALINAAVSDSGALWLWVQDTTATSQAVVPLVAGQQGAYQFQLENRVAQFGQAATPEVLRRLGDLGYAPPSVDGAAPSAARSAGGQPATEWSSGKAWSDSVAPIAAAAAAENARGQSYSVEYGLADSHTLTLKLTDPSGQTNVITAKSPYEIVSAHVLTVDQNGNILVAVTAADKSAAELRVYESVYKFFSGTTTPAIYDIPLDEGDCISPQHVAVSPAGDVYFLRVNTNRVAILKIKPRSKLSWLRVPHYHPPHYDPASERKLGDQAQASLAIPGIGEAKAYVSITAGQTITRRNVLRNGCEYLNYAWTLNQSNLDVTGNLCACQQTGTAGCQHWRAPPRLDGHTTEVVKSLPYNWGGADRLEQFQQKINASRPAGQVCTPPKGGDVIFDSNRSPNDTLPAGVDCSGFVLRAWGWPGSGHPYGTSTLHLIADPITNVMTARPGDVMNKAGSHVRMILNWRRPNNGAPADSVEMLESSTGGGGVHRKIYKLTQLYGYKPMHAKHVVDGSGSPATLTVNDLTCVP